MANWGDILNNRIASDKQQSTPQASLEPKGTYSDLFPATQKVAVGTFQLNKKLAETPSLSPTKPTVISQGQEKLSPLRAAIRAIPGNSWFERTLERDFFEPLAKIGRAIAPDNAQIMRDIVAENPKISADQLQAELKKRIGEGGGAALNDPRKPITSDDKSFSPDVIGMIKKVPVKIQSTIKNIISANSEQTALKLAKELSPDTTEAASLVGRIIGVKTEDEAVSLLKSLTPKTPKGSAFTPNTKTQALARTEGGVESRLAAEDVTPTTRIGTKQELSNPTQQIQKATPDLPTPKATQALTPETRNGLQQWMSGGNRRAISSPVVRELEQVNIKPETPITLYRVGTVDQMQFQSWSKNKPVGEEFTEKTFQPEELLVDTTDPRLVEQYTEKGQREAVEQFNRVEGEVIVKPKQISSQISQEGVTANLTPLAPSSSPVPPTSSGTLVDPPSTTVVPESKPLDKSENLSSPSTLPQVSKSVFTWVVEYVQNSEKRVKDLVSNKNLDTSTDPYEIMTLYHGRYGDQIEKGKEVAEEVAEGVVSLVGRNGESVEKARGEISEYLQALHAPERNAKLGDGAAGISTKEAAEVVKRTSPEIKAIATKALNLHKESLKLLKESGVISDELFIELSTLYKNHVPLQRVMDEADDIGGALAGKGYDVKSTGLFKAKGSSREVTDVLGNIIHNYNQAVLRAEKNIVDRATLQFVRNNKEDLAHLMVERKPKGVGMDFNGNPIKERTNSPMILQMFENGKPVWIEFKDESLALAFRGAAKDKIAPLLAAGGAVTRFLAMTATRFNPEFALSNKIRDIQEAMIYLAAQDDAGFIKAVKSAGRDPASMKAVTDFMRGVDSPGAKMYAEMKGLGGTTGGMALSTRKQTELDIDKVFSTAKSRPRKAAQRVLGAIDNWNTIFEDSTRLAVYKTAIEGGATKERAAFLAKEATINFNRSGNGGPIINALWMFSNASIQGSAKLMNAMKNPKVAAAVTTTIATAVAATGEWNDSIDPKWQDKVTKWDRLNSLPVVMPTGKDGEFRYFSIPVSWGVKPIYVMVSGAHDILSGVDLDATDLAGTVLSSVLDAYNPVGGTDLTSAAIPTAFIGLPTDIMVDIARNKNWSGAPIKPKQFGNEPEDIRYFKSLGDTVLGRSLIKGTRKLEDSIGISLSPADVNYGITQMIGGTGRSVQKTSELFYGLASDAETPPADNWPFVSRFYRERTEEEVGVGSGGEITKLQEQLSEQARERFLQKEEAAAMYKEMKALGTEAANARFDVLIETNPEMAQRISEVSEEEAMGLNYQDKLVKALGVENQERAKYLVGKFRELKSPEEQDKLWQEYIEKKIITEEVAMQMTTLANENQTP